MGKTASRSRGPWYLGATFRSGKIRGKYVASLAARDSDIVPWCERLAGVRFATEDRFAVEGTAVVQELLRACARRLAFAPFRPRSSVATALGSKKDHFRGRPRNPLVSPFARCTHLMPRQRVVPCEPLPAVLAR